MPDTTYNGWGVELYDLEGSGVVCVYYPTFNTYVCMSSLFMTNEVIRARMDNHCELVGDKVLHERKLTSIDWQHIFSRRFLTFS